MLGLNTSKNFYLSTSKLSAPMQRWDTHKLEAYACYKGVLSNEYFLLGKSFILETDHANLLFIAHSTAAIVIRWYWFMREFRIYLRYIKGSTNIVADYFSRMHPITATILGDDILVTTSTTALSQAE
jgi:RNase H-like domain found in reverse transcriptase